MLTWVSFLILSYPGPLEKKLERHELKKNTNIFTGLVKGEDSHTTRYNEQEQTKPDRTIITESELLSPKSLYMELISSHDWSSFSHN